MNTLQQGVITLMKSALTQESLPMPADFDMEQAAEAMRKHHMVTILYDGAVRCGISRQLPVMKELFQNYCRALQRSEGQMRDVQRIEEAFEANGIDYMPLKGCKMKALYPKPELRYMGDADILIRVEQYPHIETVMKNLGFIYVTEGDHEIKWNSDGLHLELHKRLIPSCNEDFYACLGEGWQLAKLHEGCCYTMTPEDEWVFLFTHFSKHYRSGGIGCRYVADLWMYLRAHPDMNEAYIRQELGKLQLLRFYENVRGLIALWFEGGENNEVLQWMTDFIFASGSWGVLESRKLSVVLRDQGSSDSTIVSRLKCFVRTLFPGVDKLRDKYTVLKKAPWMLPLVWIYRPFYKLLVKPSAFKKSWKLIRGITHEKLDEKQQMLNFVGLDYNF